jgi:hypothetical protein
VANQPEIYVSTDIEADGPIPGAHSMLSLASAAYRADKTVISTFTINLETLTGAVPDARTMAWWQGFPEAWAACRRDTRLPDAAMREYAEWLKTLPGRLVFLGFPASWDFMWVYWYLVRFTGERPFREHAMTCVLRHGHARPVFGSRAHLPATLVRRQPRTHRNAGCSLEQGAMFCNMLAENRRPSGG